MRANQLRLGFVSMSYFAAVRTVSDRACAYPVRPGHLRHDTGETAKIGALVRVSVRRVKIAMASARPWQREFGLGHALLANALGESLHIGVDADTGQIMATELTTNDIDDGSRVGPLLDQVAGPDRFVYW